MTAEGAVQCSIPAWNEADRLSALRSFEILDTEPEAAYDDIARIAAQAFDAPIAVLNFVDAQRQWFKAEVGLGVRETPLDVSICAHAILQPGLFVVPDTTKDARFRSNPLVVGEPHLRFYAGALLETSSGLPVGTICVLDYSPRPGGITKEQSETLLALARLVMRELDLRQAGRHFAEGERKFRSVTDSIPQVVWSARPDGTHDYYNERWYRFTGIPSDSTDAEGWRGVLHPEDQDRVSEKWQQSLETGDAYEVECRLRHHSGEYRWVLCRALPARDSQGHIERWFGTCTDIDDWKRAELAQAESEERYRALIEASTAIVWRADKQGSVLEGCGWTELCGQSHEQYTGSGWLGVLHPDDKDTAATAWEGAVATGSPYLTEFRVHCRDGGYRWMSARGVPLRDRDGSIREWVGTLADVHQRREAEAALEEANRTLSILIDGLQANNIRFEAALNNMAQGLCMFDAKQRLVVSNCRFLEMFRLSPKVARPGATFREILEHSFALGNYTHDEADRILSEWTGTATTGPDNVSHHHLKDGRVIAVLQTSMHDGGLLLTWQDVTEQATAERELRAYAARLEHSNRELQEFAFVASHDLQEPLRKIEAFGDRLQKKFGDVLNEDGKLYLERMQSAATRMRTLINDLLSYSRVTSQAKLFEPLDLTDVVQDVTSDLEVRIAELGATIRVAPLPRIDADRTQMRQLFQNLLSNALKFRAPDRPPHVVISSRMLGSGGTRAPRECEVEVTDNGIGFDEKYLDRIFSIFQRLHGKTEYEGNGIGLATVRKIVDRHGGAITAKSTPGQGSTFIITLPLRQLVLENAS